MKADNVFEQWLSSITEINSLSTIEELNTSEVFSYEVSDHIHVFIWHVQDSLVLQSGDDYLSVRKRASVYPHYALAFPYSIHGKIHKHDFYECSYVIKGTSRFSIAGETVELSEGDCIIMDTKCIHYDLAPDIGTRQVYIGISKEIFSEYSASFPHASLVNHLRSSQLTEGHSEQKYLVFHTRENPVEFEAVSHIIGNILEERMLEDINHLTMIHSLTERLLHHLEDSDTGKPFTIGHSTRDDYNLWKIECHISDHLRDVSIASLQESLPFNTAYYNRLIKKRFGITLTQYIQQKRLNVAKHLLTTSALSINDIIDSVGYTNRHYFYKLFEADTGVTPTRYRDLQRQRQDDFIVHNT